MHTAESLRGKGVAKAALDHVADPNRVFATKSLCADDGVALDA